MRKRYKLRYLYLDAAIFELLCLFCCVWCGCPVCCSNMSSPFVNRNPLVWMFSWAENKEEKNSSQCVKKKSNRRKEVKNKLRQEWRSPPRFLILPSHLFLYPCLCVSLALIMMMPVVLKYIPKKWWKEREEEEMWKGYRGRNEKSDYA